MGKKDRKKQRERERNAIVPPASPPIPGISRRGWRIIGTGVGVAILGYVLLSFTDPGGKNWASRLSPFVILGGYAVIALGIVARD